ncbi:HlyD family efflux transporter periplasmic adaptor subunit [Mucilaginibacter achroorhodeus]|uniref:HlyD family efflux transporter periplasmic adaptor subunit n=1 Tax=Mucilaginibacter achroorhodeus TaxID=2599294 RepID=A0A563U2A8_9SPHI|nr:HlyD family efflux transporter periplasmic adaptor subunit [Mucilaginibacter achroorhodeus]TWR24959.1 HlyD family efflux transporter periplasmic adaptor subunit [Mucilaginibacter achroorhodeus]
MPLNNDIATSARHSDDMQDIITTVPSWVLRWGTTVFFCTLVLILSLSALIRYPEIVKAKLSITSPNVAKPVIPKITGRLSKLLVQNNQTVKAGQPLAYLESTADHAQVLQLITSLTQLRQQFTSGNIIAADLYAAKHFDQLGELQGAFQTFSQSLLSYNTAVQSGFLLKKRNYLLNDITSLNKQAEQLNSERTLQQRDLALAEEDYKVHRKLADQKVETPSELRQQESKYLARKSPLIQTDAAIIAAKTNLLAKQKEILELDNQVSEEKAKFSQALNSLISQAEDWKNKYVLTASEQGKISFAGNIQQNQMVSPSADVFYINTGNEKYFGEMNIPQDNLGKVRQGQQVLVKLRSYRFEEYGMLRGRISYIADVPYKDSVFISKVSFEAKSSDMKKPIQLKQGMVADADIITEDATLLQRLTRNIVRAMNSQ